MSVAHLREKLWLTSELSESTCKALRHTSFFKTGWECWKWVKNVFKASEQTISVLVRYYSKAICNLNKFLLISLIHGCNWALKVYFNLEHSFLVL